MYQYTELCDRYRDTKKIVNLFEYCYKDFAEVLSWRKLTFKITVIRRKAPPKVILMENVVVWE